MKSSLWDDDDVDASPAELFGNLAQSLNEEVRFSGRGRVVEIVEQRGGMVRSHRALRPGQRAELLASGLEVTHRANCSVHIRGASRCMGTVKRGDGTVQLCETLEPAQDLLLHQGDVATLHFSGGFFLVRLIPAPASLAEVMHGVFKRSFRRQNLGGLLLSALWLSVVTHLLVLLGAWLWELRSPSTRAVDVDGPWDPDVVVCNFRMESTPVVEVDSLKLGIQQLHHHPNRANGEGREGIPAYNPRAPALDASQAQQDARKEPRSPRGDRGAKADFWDRSTRLGEMGHNPLIAFGMSLGTDVPVSGDRLRPTPRIFAAIATVVNRHMRELQGCYERSLLHGCNRSGRVKMELDIAAAGRVTAARTVASALDEKTTRCFQRKMARWRFPPHVGPVVAVLPFHFHSTGF